VEDTHSDALAEGGWDGVSDAHAVGTAVARADAEEDRQCEGVGLALGLLEEDGVAVEQAVTAPVAVPQPLPV
jgi:hypothetical protein